jgi:DNA-directed RNA polymerase subunit RPC12/RpoP
VSKESSMSASEPIVLYRCKACCKPVYEDQVCRGEGCSSCGGRYLQKAPPTLRYVLGYLIHNRMVLRYIKENVLGLS